MILRSASLLAAAALAGLAAPALAQHHSAPPPLPEEDWQQEQQEDWQAEEPFGDEDPDWRGEEHPGGPGDHWGAPGLPALHHGSNAGPAPRMGYSPEQRSAWFEQCHQVYRGERQGEALGAVLGGVAGAAAGNRIADGSRLAGTLIGGGVGALVGGAIGEASDRNRYESQIDQCETYLVRYEQSYVGGYGQPYAYGAQVYGYSGPVMWVRVPIMREHRRDCGCTEVVEEVVEERPAQRARRSAPARTHEKRVRYTK